MLYLFYGTDRNKAHEKALTLLAMLQKKKPDAPVFRLDTEEWQPGTLSELIGGQGLFERRCLVFGSYLLENEDAEKDILASLSDIAASGNIFILLEGKLNKSTLLPLTDAAEKVQACEAKTARGEAFNIFSLTDAFGRRDKKHLWVLYRQALASGSEPEEVQGILFWQLKSIFLASVCKSADEAGLKPFVWSKAKSFAKNFSPNELRALSQKFVTLYHDSRRGRHDFDIALERLILTI